MAKSYEELLELVLENKAITREIMKNGTEEEKEAFRKRQELYKRIGNSKSKKTQEHIKENLRLYNDPDSVIHMAPADYMGTVYTRVHQAQKKKKDYDRHDDSRRDYGMRRYLRTLNDDPYAVIGHENLKKVSPETLEKLEKDFYHRTTSRNESTPHAHISKAEKAERRVRINNNIRDKERTTDTQKRIARLKEVRKDLLKGKGLPEKWGSYGWSEPDENGKRTRIDLHQEVIKDFKKRHPSYVTVQEKNRIARRQAIEELERFKAKTMKDAEESLHQTSKDQPSDTKSGTKENSDANNNAAVKIAAAVTATAAVTAATIALLKKHNKNSKAKSLLKQTQDLQEKIQRINARLKNGEITEKEAAEQTKACNEKIDKLIKEMKALSKPTKESGECDIDYEADLITEATIFESAEEFDLDDNEICELLESIFGEACFCGGYDGYDGEIDDLILTICESVENGEIAEDDGLELIGLLESAKRFQLV